MPEFSCSQRGFTLLSVMIAVAIIGILATIAYPRYMDQVRQSRRTEATSMLMRAANRQERYYTVEYTYADSMAKLGLPTVTENGWYKVRVTRASDTAFEITATPRGGQTGDICAKLTINQLGQQKAYNDSGAVISDKCW